MAKKDIQNVDPVVSGTTSCKCDSEDDFDEQFEALSKALSEEEVWTILQRHGCSNAQYTFGRSIAQFGVSVFACDNARKGKKVFGNDLILPLNYGRDTG
ncbi:MAG: hypothetical protein CM15mV22_2510 [Eurybiavirus sp.]|nr:MAG: hypothetical protein CM15mV22_2510 [Eurybiavirus sp.]